MGLINISNIPDGTTMEASDVNNQTNTIVNEINGNLNDTNLADNAVTQVKMADNSVGTAELKDANVTMAKIASEAWTAWTPSLTNINIGNGIIDAAYHKIGRTVICRINIILGSTSSVSGNPSFTLPFNCNASYFNGHYAGTVRYVDSGTAGYFAVVYITPPGTGTFAHFGAAGSYLSESNATSTIPFTWAKDDTIYGTFVYEAVS